tara:strand:- start:90 stop:308 length:219 start_codon:yes stop_codon:yes gene_type:complete
MIEKNHIVKLVKEYINRFGYIEWEELVDIQVNEEICTIIFIALQKDNKKSYTYKINFEFESGKIDGLQLIEE